jgi:hypothetical protein
MILQRDTGTVRPVFHHLGPLTWWGYVNEHSPHRHLKLRLWRIELHAQAWINRYPLSTSRWCFRLSGHYDRKHGSGYAGDTDSARLRTWLRAWCATLTLPRSTRRALRRRFDANEFVEVERPAQPDGGPR